MPSTPWDQFETSASLEQEGVWLDFGSYRVKVARAGGANKRYTALIDVRMRPHRRQIEKGTLGEEFGKKLIMDCFAETVVLDWEGMVDSDRVTPLPFSADNVKMIFTALPNFYEEIMAACTDIANFRSESLEQDAKK